MPFCFPIIHPSKVVRHAVVVATACVFSCSAGAASYRVIGIADGDTITVLDDDKRMVKCRLYGIDAPEKHQAYGAESKASLSEMTFHPANCRYRLFGARPIGEVDLQSQRRRAGCQP